MRRFLRAAFICTALLTLDFSTTVTAAPPNPPTFRTTPPAALYPNTYPQPASGPYTVTVDFTDPDGRSDLNNCYLRLAQADNENNNRQTMMWFPGNTCVQWDDEPHRLTNLSCSSTTITNGYRITFSFKLNSSWTPSKNVDFYAWAYDGQASSSHVKNNRNTIYDNGLRIADAWREDCVDQDGDGYCSQVDICEDSNTAVSSRTVGLVLYRRPDAGGDTAVVGETGDYTIFGTNSSDARCLPVTAPSRGIYDFAWELYAGGAFIDNRGWFDGEPNISNVRMETKANDLRKGLGIWIKPHTVIAVEDTILDQLNAAGVVHVSIQTCEAEQTCEPERDDCPCKGWNTSQYDALSTFVRLAHSTGIDVRALCYGRIDGVIPERGEVQEAIDAVLAYNARSPKESAFDGVELDIENIDADDMSRYVRLFEDIDVPDSLIFSAALQQPMLEWFDDLTRRGGLDLLIPMLYIMDNQGNYADGVPKLANYDFVRDGTSSSLAALDPAAQLMTGVSSYDRSIILPKTYSGSIWTDDVERHDRLAFHPASPFSVPRLISDGKDIQWVRYYAASGITIYRFEWDVDRWIDVIETTPLGVREHIAAADDVGSADLSYSGSHIWLYELTFDGLSGRDEGLLPDDGQYPEPFVGEYEHPERPGVRLLAFDNGVATIRVTLWNGNPAERILGSHASAGVHLRLDGEETFLSAEAGDISGGFHAVEAFDRDGNLTAGGRTVTFPAGTDVIELRRSFFQDPNSQVATSGEIRIAATSAFELKYRSWMRDKDSTCTQDDLEPYIARQPNDICYHDPAPGAFLAYRVATQIIEPKPPQDSDGDGVPDDVDNCVCVQNPTQCNANANVDDFGNHCDPDLTNDGVVGVPDFNVFRACFGSREGDANFDPACDFDCDGVVGIPDFNILRNYFGAEPGGTGCVGTAQQRETHTLKRRKER